MPGGIRAYCSKVDENYTVEPTGKDVSGYGGAGSRTDHACIVLQVDLGLLRFVTAVGTQGAISKETKKKYYVKTYRVDISSNGEDWITIKEGSKPVVSGTAVPFLPPPPTESLKWMINFYLFVWELSVWPGLVWD